MRYGYGIGFLVLLIGVALWAFLSAKNAQTTLRTGKQAKEQVQPWTGKTADGQTAEKSVDLDGESNNGNLNDLLVTSVTPGGYFEQYYGLKTGDKVLQIGGIDVGTLGGEDFAKAKVAEASTTGDGTLTILRNGQKFTLNSGDGTLGNGRGARLGAPSAPSTPATPASPSTPAAPPAAPAPPRNPPPNASPNAPPNGSGGQTYPGYPGIRIPQIPQPQSE